MQGWATGKGLRCTLSHGTSFDQEKILVAAATVLLLADVPALAQMQIPNPLIRPRSLTNPGAKEPAGAEAMAPRGAPTGASAPTGLAVASPEEIYAKSLAELKDRFSTFYVSAIVGKQAILRRSLGGPRGGVLASGGALPTLPGASSAPIALAGAQPQTASAPSGRSDTLMLSDGELLDSVGSSGALIAKINSRQVTIYHVQETMSMPNGKLIGKRAVVFAGDVENSGSTPPPAIVLERVDPAYKRMITVDTRIRSTSSPQDASNGNNAGAGATPPTPPQ